MKRWMAVFLTLCLLAMPAAALGEAETQSANDNVQTEENQTADEPENGGENEEEKAEPEENTDAENEQEAEPESENENENQGETPPPSDEPTQKPDVTDEPETIEIDWEAVWENEAWFYEEDGSVFAGTLNEVCRELLARDEQAQVEDEHEVVLCREDGVMTVEEIRRCDINRFVFCIDDRVIEQADKKLVMIEEIRADEAEQETDEPDPEEIVSYNIWIEPVQEPTEEPTAEPTAEPTPEPTQAPAEISADAENYNGEGWSGEVPVFTLSGIPEDQPYWEYGVVVFGRRIELVDDGVYTADAEGEYTLRFVILDDWGDVAAATDNYNLMLDFTPPMIGGVSTETGVSYQMIADVSDELSGVESASIDGGETWFELPEDGMFVYTAESETVIPAGMIQVRDRAGNIAVWEEEVTLKRFSWGGGGGGGGGSGENGGGNGEYKPHSSGSGKAGPGYDRVSVEAEREAMHVLTLDGKELELTLLLDAADGFEFDETYEPLFTVGLAAWPQFAPDEEGNPVPEEPLVIDEDNPDTMVLEAQTDEAIEGAFTYRWQMGGAVLRQLKNSGVRYLVLKNGDHVTALPTEGFLAGEKYAELKMQGVSTRRFAYDVVVSYDPEKDVELETEEKADSESEPDDNDETDEIESAWTTEITVTVNDEAILLTEDETQDIYMTDVYSGPAELMEVPFGTWQPEDAESMKE